MEIPQLFQQKPLKGSWKILKKGVHVMWYHCRCDVCVCVCLEHVQWIFRWSAKEPWQFYPVFSSHEILLGQLVSWVTIPKPGVSYPTNHLYISYQLYCSYISYITLYNCIIYIYIYILYIYPQLLWLLSIVCEKISPNSWWWLQLWPFIGYNWLVFLWDYTFYKYQWMGLVQYKHNWYNSGHNCRDYHHDIAIFCRTKLLRPVRGFSWNSWSGAHRCTQLKLAI